LAAKEAEGEEQDDGKTVKVSLDKIQRSGVRTEAVGARVIVHPVRAVGTDTAIGQAIPGQAEEHILSGCERS
jgi:hypothetical protein